MGMAGGAERKDSKEVGSEDGMAALMAKKADALFAKASTKNVRVDAAGRTGVAVSRWDGVTVNRNTRNRTSATW